MSVSSLTGFTRELVLRLPRFIETVTHAMDTPRVDFLRRWGGWRDFMRRCVNVAGQSKVRRQMEPSHLGLVSFARDFRGSHVDPQVWRTT